VLNTQSLAGMITACPIKKFELEISYSGSSNIQIPAGTLTDIFAALSLRKLEHLTIELYPDILNNTT